MRHENWEDVEEQEPDDGEYNPEQQFLQPKNKDHHSGILMTLNNFEQNWINGAKDSEDGKYFSSTIVSAAVMGTVDHWEEGMKEVIPNFNRMHARSLMLEILLNAFESIKYFDLENVRACMFQALYDVTKSFEKKQTNYEELGEVDWENAIVILWNAMDLSFAYRGMGRGFRAQFHPVSFEKSYTIDAKDRQIIAKEDNNGPRFPPHKAAIQNYNQTPIFNIYDAKNQLYKKLPSGLSAQELFDLLEKKKNLRPWNSEHANLDITLGHTVDKMCKKIGS